MHARRPHQRLHQITTPAIHALLAAFRAARRPVLHIVFNCLLPDGSDLEPALYDRVIRGQPYDAWEIRPPQDPLSAILVELALRRYAFNVKPLTPEVVADQQRIADTFYALKLIPKAIQVREAVIVPQP